MFDSASHRDFLGAVLATGIDRRVLGDVVVLGERGAQLLCTPEIAPHVEASLAQARRHPAACARSPGDTVPPGSPPNGSSPCHV